ncbi:MAG: tRNA (guanosine(37)-N1)-methyltransferase TrmD [Deltaproteobacteria bacterium]|nr:tRNA (guanosine(37)-N1)-methyltransferase TrmD [Deltaproteobacteria bacterium]
MRFDILSIFPEIFTSPFEHSILKRAREAGLIDINLVNIRDFAEDRHCMTDDYPYGGGSGMVMKPEPIVKALRHLEEKSGRGRVILLSPSGKRFDQSVARRLSIENHLVFVCGRYEGIDERIRERFVDEEISIGDYILTGGEFPAMVIVDAVSRLIPGVLGCAGSTEEESFSGDILEYPQYTRPPEFEGMRVPDVLLSGNHAEIARWRRREAIKKTLSVRPDLLEKAALTYEDKKNLREIEAERID